MCLTVATVASCSAAGQEAACREHLNKLNAAVHGLHGLASGVQVRGHVLSLLGFALLVFVGVLRG